MELSLIALIVFAVVGVIANYFFSGRFGLLYHLFNNLWGFNWYESVFDSYIYLIIAGSWKPMNHHTRWTCSPWTPFTTDSIPDWH